MDRTAATQSPDPEPTLPELARQLLRGVQALQREQTENPPRHGLTPVAPEQQLRIDQHARSILSEEQLKRPLTPIEQGLMKAGLSELEARMCAETN